jgi:hypothetical protein
VITSIDKALTALIMGALSLLTLLFGVELFGEHQADVIGYIVFVLTPILVWLVPNKNGA